MSGVRDLVATLEMPPGPPPVVTFTRLQSLPFGNLRWDDFEKLCLRLARSDQEIEDARRYGVQGQGQYGIDLLARRPGTGGYTVYQCKKVEKFGPAAITAAVDMFLEGPWADRADRFVLCTSLSLAPRQRADRLRVETERMAGLGITLVPWDADGLDILLKDQPRLVDDFFGRAAVTAFCGQDAADRLGERLDGRDVAEYRRRLHDLYSAVFAQLDPGLPVPPGLSEAAVDLRDRYVVPDVAEAVPEAQALPDPAGPSGQANVQQDPLRTGTRADEVPDVGGGRTSSGNALLRLRQPLGAWLAGAKRCLLVGGTGSGKSAALRFVTLDLLDENPQLTDLAPHWGGRIPVWVSFPYWTALIAREPEGVSLPECARRWLGAYGQAGLWTLVERALADDRLLLIVDGLDEWATEDAARTATHLLQVFVQASDLPILAAGRPYGVQRLELRGGRWNLAEIAELSPRQQYQITKVWTQIRLATAHEPPPTNDLDRLAEEESTRFTEEVRAAVDLAQLAENPMLLTLLLYLRLRNADLPSNRFEAYDEVIGHLIAAHPAARRRAAFANDTPPEPGLVRRALAYLAYCLQREHHGNDADDNLVGRYVADVLGSADEPGLGLAPEAAAATAATILAAAEEGFGLLVRTSAGTVRFFHRAIQEHLAAVHIARLPSAEQSGLVSELGTDPQWEPSILSLLWLAPGPSQAQALLDALPAAAAGPAGEQCDRIRTEVAFGPFDATPGWVQSAAEQAVSLVEKGERLAHQAQILDRVLTGIDNPRTSNIVNGAVGQWIYDRAANGASAVAATARWPQAPETWHMLTVALSGRDSYAQRTAGLLISQIYRGDRQARDLLVEAASTSQRATTRAAALDALTRGWPDDPVGEELITRARQSPASDVVVAAIDAIVRRRATSNDDFRQLVSLISGDQRYPFSAWIDAVPQILKNGWVGNAELRDLCLEGARRQWEHGTGIKNSIATALLASAFPGDDQVAAWIANELDQAQHPFLMASQPQTWKNIASSFRDHPVVVQAAVRWIHEQRYRDSEVSLLALVSRTEQMRDLLISHIATAGFPHWEAASLLEGWGIQDTTVAAALRQFLDDRAPARASAIAHLVPQIVEDPGEARAMLMAMLRAPDVARPDFVVDGLAQLDEPGDVTEIIAAAEPYLTGGIADPLTALIIGFPQHPRIRDLAISALDQHNAPITAVAHAYADDPEMRLIAARCLTPVAPALRARVIAALGRRPPSDATTTSLLGHFDADQNGNVKLLAAAAWARRIRHEPETAAAAAERLTAVMTAGGLDHETRRRAAFGALLILGRAEIFTGLREQAGNAGPVRISPDLLHRDLEFVRLVAEHWNTLKELLGDQLPTRLSAYGHEDTFWTAMCTVATAYPDIRPDVLRAIDTSRHVAASAPAVRFTAAIRAGTPALLEQALGLVDVASGPSISRGNLELALLAADTIARQFAGDPDVPARLANPRLSRWDLGRVAALSRGWPDHPVIRALYQQQWPADQPTWADRELRYAMLPAGQLVAEFRSDVRGMIQTGDDQIFLVSGPLTARLRRDSEAASAFEDDVAAGTDPIMKAAIPSALAVAGALTPRTADWCTREIERQFATESPDLGFDLRAGTVRGVAVALSDVLQGPSA